MQQSQVGFMPFSTPNVKTTPGLSVQAECGEAGTQESSTGNIGWVHSASGGHKCQKPANDDMDGIGQSEEDADLWKERECNTSNITNII